MNSLPPALLAACLVLLLASPGTDPEVAQDTGPRQVSAEPDGSNPGPAHAPRQRADAPPQARRTVLPATLEPRPPDEAQDAVIRRYCVRCHNDRRLRGNLSLESFQTASAYQNAEVAEKMIRKLRAAMMPPPRSPRPGGDTLQALVELLETRIDEAAAADQTPGGRPFQRLNRAEYQRSIKDLLDLEVDAGDYLPLDTKSANFDNIADVQMVSPTLLDAYLNAAAEISRLAVGNVDATPSETQYRVPRWVSQVERVDGAPYGTRGGTSVVHTFPADGEYVFRVSFHHETTGTVVGNGRSALHTAEAPEQVEVSIDGERVALLDMDRWMHVSDPDGVNMRTDPVFVAAGPRRVTAAFIQRAEGPVQDLVSPHDWSLASTAIAGTYGVLSLPHLRDLVIGGPFAASGVSDTPSRQRIFTCRPQVADQERPCARAIVTELGAKAFRRPLTADDEGALMAFYDEGAADGGFEVGVRTALEAMLASPHFVFRFEEPPATVEPGESYRIAGEDLAARLSFFLWGAPPDDELSAAAAREELSDPGVLEAQTRRMLADPRAEALGTRFAAQWLRLQDLDKIHPDVRLQPDFHQQLADAMRRETELFFYGLVRDDRSVLDLYQADYTYLNERLARHYGIPGVTGEHFRRVAYPDETRRGVFGHGSILTMTSHAGRTSPVLRGKWVMEVLLGTPPPPPPPGVPDLEETEGTADGRFLTTRERMEQHRANPTCRSCHRFMDPIGLALDNYDVTGRWRIRENGRPLDTRGELYDGTPVASPVDLQEALLRRPIPLIRTFTENLMAYALGRRVEYYDQPRLRTIVRDAEANGYRMSSFILGIVASEAFQMQTAGTVARSVDKDDRP
jgi:hypothetical protein